MANLRCHAATDHPVFVVAPTKGDIVGAIANSILAEAIDTGTYDR